MSVDSQLDVLPVLSFHDSCPGKPPSRHLVNSTFFFSHCLKGLEMSGKQTHTEPDQHGSQIADHFHPIWKEQRVKLLHDREADICPGCRSLLWMFTRKSIWYRSILSVTISRFLKSSKVCM